MKSPFPGMDPYLERHWLDVHARLVVTSSEQLQHQLGDNLVARVEERIVVETPAEASRRLVGPDLRVVEHGHGGTAPEPTGGVALAEPMRFTVRADLIRQRFIEIYDLSTGGRVVSVIEFVSPTNKLPGDGRNKYILKQEECQAGGVNLVEIDLTRQGYRILLAHSWVGTRQHDSTYQVSVWRAASPEGCDLIPLPLEKRLPAIAIPLRATDRDVVLDLQPLVDGAYVAGGYGRSLDYTRPCVPPLEGAEAEWAVGLRKGAQR